MATTAYRNWRTPYEILRGSQPSIAHLRPFWTKAFVQVPKTKRAKKKKWGQPHQRTEIGHRIGYQDLWGSTARVLLDRNLVVHSRNVTYDSKSVTNPTPAPIRARGEGPSVAERELEELIEGFQAMGLSATSLKRGGERIIQEGAATEKVPVVNPDPSTEAPFTPDHDIVSEGMPWDSTPESSKPTLVTPPEIFRTLPEGQADAPSPEDIIEWEGSPEWTTHGLPAVPDFIELNPADAGLRRSSRVTSNPAYHINYMVPVSPRDEFLDTMTLSHIQQHEYL